MGTTCMQKPTNVKQYFEDQYTWEDEYTSRRLLDAAIVNMREYYGALEITTKATGERQVIAVVNSLSFDRSFYGFCYKDMDETMGPIQDNCPERILKLLTPTDHEYAHGWRNRCWANIERRKRATKLVVGETVKFAHPIQFQGGAVEDTFTVDSYPIRRGRTRKILRSPKIYGYVAYSLLHNRMWARV